MSSPSEAAFPRKKGESREKSREKESREKQGKGQAFSGGGGTWIGKRTGIFSRPEWVGRGGKSGKRTGISLGQAGKGQAGKGQALKAAWDRREKDRHSKRHSKRKRDRRLWSDLFGVTGGRHSRGMRAGQAVASRSSGGRSSLVPGTNAIRGSRPRFHANKARYRRPSP